MNKALEGISPRVRKRLTGVRVVDYHPNSDIPGATVDAVYESTNGDKGVGFLTVGQHLVQDPKSEAGVLEAERSGYLSKTGFKTGLDRTVAHELGHHLYQNMTDDQKQRMFRSVFGGPTWEHPAPPAGHGVSPAQLVNQNRAGIINRVGTYAATDPHEFVSELWAQYKGSDNPSALAQLVGEHIEDSMDDYVEPPTKPKVSTATGARKHDWVQPGVQVQHKDGSIGNVVAYEPATQTMHVRWESGKRGGTSGTTKAYHTASVPAAPAEASLTDSEQAAVRDYAGSAYTPVNEFLREGKQSGIAQERQRVSDTIKNLDSALDKSRISKPTTVYRGMTRKVDWDASNKAGRQVTIPSASMGQFSDQGYMSVSSREQAAKNFARGTRFEIHLPAGHPLVSAGEHALSSSEQDYILPRNSKFDVISHRKEDDGTDVFVMKPATSEPKLTGREKALYGTKLLPGKPRPPVDIKRSDDPFDGIPGANDEPIKKADVKPQPQPKTKPPQNDFRPTATTKSGARVQVLGESDGTGYVRIRRANGATGLISSNKLTHDVGTAEQRRVELIREHGLEPLTGKESHDELVRKLTQYYSSETPETAGLLANHMRDHGVAPNLVTGTHSAKNRALVSAHLTRLQREAPVPTWSRKGNRSLLVMIDDTSKDPVTEDNKLATNVAGSYNYEDHVIRLGTTTLLDPPRNHEPFLNRNRYFTSSGGASFVERTITHEYGHALDLNSEPGARSLAVRRAASMIPNTPPMRLDQYPSEWLKENKAAVINHVSTYASANVREFMAELYAEYKHAARPSPAAQVAGRFLEGKS